MKEIALRLAALTTLRDAVDEEVTRLRDEVKANLIVARQTMGVKAIDIDLGDGTIVATVTVTDAKPRLVVFNEDDFAAWVQQHFPSEVTVVVRPTSKKAILDNVEWTGDTAVYTPTGEVVDGVTALNSAESIAVRFKTDGRDAIKEAWRSGDLQQRVPLMLTGGAE